MSRAELAYAMPWREIEDVSQRLSLTLVLINNIKLIYEMVKWLHAWCTVLQIADLCLFRIVRALRLRQHCSFFYLILHFTL